MMNRHRRPSTLPSASPPSSGMFPKRISHPKLLHQVDTTPQHVLLSSSTVPVNERSVFPHVNMTEQPWAGEYKRSDQVPYS